MGVGMFLDWMVLECLDSCRRVACDAGRLHFARLGKETRFLA